MEIRFSVLLMKFTFLSHGVFAFSHEKIKAIFNLENGQPARNFISIEKCITPTISILILIQIDFETSKIQLFSLHLIHQPKIIGLFVKEVRIQGAGKRR